MARQSLEQRGTKGSQPSEHKCVMSTDTAMRRDAEYEGLKKKEKLILFIRQSGFLTHAHSCWRGGSAFAGRLLL